MHMNDSYLVSDLFQIIDKVTLDVIAVNNAKWEIDEDDKRLIYTLAFNDGAIALANLLRTELNPGIPEEFEVDEDDKS